ncbi:MAG: CehA/McbA family metallohydrolase, partial [Candidatus Heimdallarchaeaceae archaeon]
DHITPYVPETNVTYNVLFDQHSHTKYSDGVLTVRQNIEWHISLGYNAFTLTDHNTLRNSADIQELAEEYKEEIIIIQGMEWTSNRLHMNIIGLSHWDLKISNYPTDTEIEAAIDEAHNQGAVVVVNHLHWSMEDAEDLVPTRDQLLSWGVDYIEIYNGPGFDEDSYEFCLEHNESIGMISGTDMHSPDRSDFGRVFAWTALNTDNFTEEAVMKELQARNTEIIYESQGVEDEGIYGKSATYIVFRPFYGFGDFLRDYHIGMGQLNAVGVVFFFIYYFGIFTIIELTPIVNKKIKLRKTVKEG